MLENVFKQVYKAGDQLGKLNDLDIIKERL